jgi:NitT/TauT family transport system substrate-binding protein
MNTKIIRSSSLLVLVMALFLSACGAKDKVTVQLSWFHSAEFIGFYVADQLGYYADENLDVTLTGGGPEIDPVATVADGSSQFGVTSGDSIIRAQSAGQDMVAISSIFRKSPLIVMALTDSRITSPQDLAGKTVGVVSTGLDTTWDIQLIAMLKKTGVDPAGITFVSNEEFHGAADLHTGRMDASSGTFSTNELVQAKIDNELVTPIYYSEYGVEFYNNVIFTGAQLSADNPDLVQRFIRATLRGYQYAIENPKEAAALTIKYDETLDVAFQQATIEAQIPLIDSGDAPIGWMDEDVWTGTQTILLDQGYITSPIDLTKVYSNDFIK